MKSSIADPSRKNSGFDAISKPPLPQTRPRIAATRRPVPTGTVDLVITTVLPPSSLSASARPMSSAAAKT
jgi:hypothetical protein